MINSTNTTNETFGQIVRQRFDALLAMFQGKMPKDGELIETSFRESGKQNSKFVIDSIVDIVLNAFTSIGNAFTKAERDSFLSHVWHIERGNVEPMPELFAKGKQLTDNVESPFGSEQARFDKIRSTNENGRSQREVIKRCHTPLVVGAEYAENVRPLNFFDCLGNKGTKQLASKLADALGVSGNIAQDDITYMVNSVSALIPLAKDSTVTLQELSLDEIYATWNPTAPAKSETAQAELAKSVKAKPAQAA